MGNMYENNLLTIEKDALIKADEILENAQDATRGGTQYKQVRNAIRDRIKNIDQSLSSEKESNMSFTKSVVPEGARVEMLTEKMSLKTAIKKGLIKQGEAVTFKLTLDSTNLHRNRNNIEQATMQTETGSEWYINSDEIIELKTPWYCVGDCSQLLSIVGDLPCKTEVEILGTNTIYNLMEVDWTKLFQDDVYFRIVS